jgi:hypothetical protein
MVISFDDTSVVEASDYLYSRPFVAHPGIRVGKYDFWYGDVL